MPLANFRELGHPLALNALLVHIRLRLVQRPAHPALGPRQQFKRDHLNSSNAFPSVQLAACHGTETPHARHVPLVLISLLKRARLVSLAQAGLQPLKLGPPLLLLASRFVLLGRPRRPDLKHARVAQLGHISS